VASSSSSLTICVAIEFVVNVVCRTRIHLYCSSLLHDAHRAHERTSGCRSAAFLARGLDFWERRDRREAMQQSSNEMYVLCTQCCAVVVLLLIVFASFDFFLLLY